MEIKLKVPVEVARVAIGAHLLNCPEEPVDASNFETIIATHIFFLGTLGRHFEDEINAQPGVAEKAASIVKKYFK